jgi:hypothetical protein
MATTLLVASTVRVISYTESRTGTSNMISYFEALFLTIFAVVKGR